MTDRFDLLVKGGTLVNHDGRGEGDVAVKDGRIKQGDMVLLEAMGGGFTWGASLVRL